MRLPWDVARLLLWDAAVFPARGDAAVGAALKCYRVNRFGLAVAEQIERNRELSRLEAVGDSVFDGNVFGRDAHDQFIGSR
ncbi:MAG TPA: hypothetical protein VH107_05580, partial [Lacipirellulaceae bacterium]|nr:hypothetical protein [Lacipirellulaceae bacterium]